MISEEVRSKYQLVVGLEVHAQLQTKTKIFCADSNSFGDPPNTNVSTISLGHPGAMPKLNKKAVEYAIKMGLACQSKISEFQFFDRKNYFYPDLPKGYQVTQDKTPICVGGKVPVTFGEGQSSVVELNRIHLEEDAGKSIHTEDDSDSFIDLNRAGTPLIEIVTEPVIHSAEEAGAFLTEVRKMVRFLEICDGNMEEGSLRCDANVSVMLHGAEELGKKVEVKNMNSIKNVVKAILHERDRQITLLASGGEVISETRTYDPDTVDSFGMRTKEELNDYRYFPEPDLSPIRITDDWLQTIKGSMPMLSSEYVQKFKVKYGLNEKDARMLADQRDMAHFFDALCGQTKNYKAAANWTMGPFKSYLNDRNLSIEASSVTALHFAQVIALVDEGKLSFSTASQQLFPYLIDHPLETALEAAQHLNLFQDSDVDSIQTIINEVLIDQPQKVKAYKNGKKGLLGMFMGEIMKKTNGKADPKMANQLLRESLETVN